MNKGELREFYNKTQPRLTAWVRRRVGNEADVEEIVQDTFLALVDSLPAYGGKSSLWTFLVSIAKHEVADYWRKRYAKKAILTVPFMDQIYTEKLYSADTTAKEIEKAYKRLLPEQKIILMMKYEENKQLKEIANYLKISVKAAESRLFRARQAFKFAYANLNGSKI